MRFLRHLYVQVLIGVVIGGLIGTFFPAFGADLKPLGDAFVSLIKMLIGPIIFTTVVVGLAGMSDLKQAGRVGLKAFVYFEIVTTLALVVGLVVANLFTPGAGIHATAASLEAKASSVAVYANAAQGQGVVEFLLHLIPKTFFSAFVEGDVLQVLLLSLLFGLALGRLGDHGRPVLNLLNEVSRVFFGIVSMVTKIAPLAAAGAMAFTIGRYGLGSLVQLGQLMLCVYLTSAIFVFLVLGSIARAGGFSLWKILRLIKEELAIVLGTSSSESALPGLMEKMEKVGCARPTVGLVVPAGYSFNLDGTCIYLTMAALFIAQATDTPMTLAQQLGLLAVLLLTSKGAAGVTGSGFITLAATLATTGHVPVAGIALILGVDRFMSEARAITNFIGNAVATLVISKWNGDFDRTKGGDVLR
jgi:aerobic C4-dicarboxylate transport protein